MARGARTLVAFVTAVALSAATARAVMAQGPSLDLRTAFSNAFAGVDACVALRDVAPGAETATSDPIICARRAAPCATFDIPATVIALDRGVAPDIDAPVKRNPPIEGDPPNGVSLRDAFRKPVPWVYEEIARRVGSDAFSRALAGMRYGNAEAEGPVEKLGRGDDGLTVSAVEQVEFLARMKRGELPIASEAQVRAVEAVEIQRIGDATLALKGGSCRDAGWAVGWLDRGQRSVIFAVLEAGAGSSQEDVAARTRKVLAELGLLPPPPQ